MDWLTEHKIPVGKWAGDFFDWLENTFSFFFDALSDLLETMIDGLLWLLQTPNPLILIALFGALTWVLQRNWKTVALVVVGLILYWVAKG